MQSFAQKQHNICKIKRGVFCIIVLYRFRGLYILCTSNFFFVTEAVQKATGPLLIELDKTPGAALGISLSHARHKGKHCVCIDSIRPASIADR